MNLVNFVVIIFVMLYCLPKNESGEQWFLPGLLHPLLVVVNFSVHKNNPHYNG
jgi:hypothetical protein